MYTLEINGRSIAVIMADEAQTRDLVDDPDFLDDLRGMESDGAPLWNGSDELTVRAASADEIEAAELGLEDDDEEDEDEDEGVVVFFLVGVDDDED